MRNFITQKKQEKTKQTESPKQRRLSLKTVKLPQTPNSYASLVNDLIDNATPSKTGALTNRNLHKSAERSSAKLILNTSRDNTFQWKS